MPAMHLIVRILLLAWSFLLASAIASTPSLLNGEDVTSVKSLPGLLGSVPDRSMFAGYLEVSGRHYYYVFVRAQTLPDSAPFFFWTNGGPGCSSVGEGLWMEHGPYRVSNAHAGVEPNPFSWNRFANILYLEHPVGVGFSYSDESSDYMKLNDFREADDLYYALIAFMDTYPQFSPSKSHGLYLAGESYGGEYVPHLAHRIMFGESQFLKDSLRGIAIANPRLNCAADTNGYNVNLQYQLYFHHGLMSFEQFRKWADQGCDQGVQALSVGCQKLMREAVQAVGTVNQQLLKKRRHAQQWAALELAAQTTDVEANFDPDHKYQSFCLANSTLQFALQPNGNSQECHPLGDPGRMGTYLNRQDVQAALHIRTDKVASPRWTDCAGDWINYTMSGANVLTDYLEPIFAMTDPAQFRMLVFSGDEDIATCPGPITQSCLSELKSKVKRTTAWKPWTHNGITAGYYEQFDRYTYATVKVLGSKRRGTH